MKSPLIMKIHEVLRQEVLNNLNVRYPFGGINPLDWKTMDKRFRCELTRNEADSYGYLMENKEIEVPQKELQAKVKEPRARGYFRDPGMLFENF